MKYGKKVIDYDFNLTTDGAGIVLYSDNAITFEEGEDFFSKEFSTPDKVAEHLAKGDIIGFNTGSSGDFVIKIRNGYPSEKMLAEYPIAIRLAIEVKGGRVNIMDVLWLSEWSDTVPEEQSFMIEDGFYHVTVMTKKPDTGIWGDDQEIFMFFEEIEGMPTMAWKGVPQLFK